MTRPRALTPVRLTKEEWRYVALIMTAEWERGGGNGAKTIARKIGLHGTLAATRGVAPMKDRRSL